jgi:hypothetical protein
MVNMVKNSLIKVILFHYRSMYIIALAILKTLTCKIDNVIFKMFIKKTTCAGFLFKLYQKDLLIKFFRWCAYKLHYIFNMTKQKYKYTLIKQVYFSYT